jgi:hypothetical protein
MCSGAESPYCEECEAKEIEWREKNHTAEHMPDTMLCEHCKEMLTRYCWACMNLYDTKEEAQIVDGACKTCRE